MQVYFVLLLVAAASATPVTLTNLLKHKPNNAPVLNLNHKNVVTQYTQHVPVVDTVEVVAPKVYTTLNKPVVSQVVPQVYNQVVPQVYNQVVPQVVSQVVPQVYTVPKPVVPQVYTNQYKEVAPKVQVVPQVYSQVQTPVVHTPQVYNVQTPVVQTPQVYSQVQTPVVQTPQVYSVQTPVVVPQTKYVKTVQTVPALTPGYVAANHGALHTAPLPEGPSNDGFYASHHINLPNAKA